MAKYLNSNDMSTNAKDYLQVVLEDDSTPYGGISFVGETLENFLAEVDLPIDTDMIEVNEALVECGIKPVFFL